MKIKEAAAALLNQHGLMMKSKYNITNQTRERGREGEKDISIAYYDNETKNVSLKNQTQKSRRSSTK
jgi:hypothetical protein